MKSFSTSHLAFSKQPTGNICTLSPIMSKEVGTKNHSTFKGTTFYHVHIPKCGGTSISTFFNEITNNSQSVWLDRFEHAPNIVKRFILSNLEKVPMTAADYDRYLIRYLRETNLNDALEKVWSCHVNELGPTYVHNPFSRHLHIEYPNSVFLFPIKSTFERYISYLMHFEKFSENDLMYLTPREHLRFDQIRNWPVEKLIDFTYSENIESFHEFSFCEIDETLTRVMNSRQKSNTFKNKASFLKKTAIKVDQISAFLNEQAIHSNISVKVLNSGKLKSRFRELTTGDLSEKSLKFLGDSPDERLWNEFSS